MKKYFFLTLAFSLIRICLFTQDWDWAKAPGGPAIDKVTGIAHDHSGNIFITGYFDSIIVFDSVRLVSSGGTDIFLAKYDPDGVLLWAKQVGGQNDDYSSGISTDITGNCYLTGYVYIQGNISSFGNTTVTSAGDADIFISKFTGAGNLLWVRNAGGKTDDVSYGIATDVSGNSYITGYFTGIATFGNFKLTSAGYSDIFVAKYDAAGNIVWVKSGGGAYQDEGYSICTDVAGNCYVTGYFTGNSKFNGTLLSSAGYFDTDVFLLKYNPSGVLIWAKRAGGSGNDFGFGINVASNNAIYISGVYKGTKLFGDNSLSKSTGSNGFLARFDSYGKLDWSKNTNGDGTNEFRQVATDAMGSPYIVGTISDKVSLGNTEFNSKGGKDACIAKYDEKGNLMWFLQGGGTENDEGLAIAVEGTGICYAGGTFTDNASFGRFKFSGKGLTDCFFSRIK